MKPSELANEEELMATTLYLIKFMNDIEKRKTGTTPVSLSEETAIIRAAFGSDSIPKKAVWGFFILGFRAALDSIREDALTIGRAAANAYARRN
jgi:hypothetical protein